MESINEGYYISLILDRYYIEETPNYNKNHLYHNTLIYGYDTEKRAFYIRDNFRKFSDREYQFEHVERAYYAGLDCEDLGVNAAGAVTLIERLDQVLYDFNIDYLLNELEFYLHSYGAEVCKKYNVVNHYRAQLPRVKVYYFNLGVYDYFRKMLSDPESIGGIDYRACYTFYEHKLFMGKRIEFLMKRGILSEDTDLYKMASRISEEAEKFMYIMMKLVIKYETKSNTDRMIYIGRLIDKIECMDIEYINALINEIK